MANNNSKMQRIRWQIGDVTYDALGYIIHENEEKIQLVSKLINYDASSINLIDKEHIISRENLILGK